MKKINTPKLNEILVVEFMKPLGISSSSLASSIGVSFAKIEGILNGHEEVTADISARLGRYFGVAESYFLNLQASIAERNRAAR